MKDLYIKDQEIANALGVHLTKLNSYADKIGLQSIIHYKVINRSQPIRLYLIPGLKLLYQYLNQNQSKTKAASLRQLLISKRDKHLEALVHQVVLENTQSLLVFNGISFISQTEAIRILRTTSKQFEQVLHYVKKSKPLKIDIHFRIESDQYFFSPTGIFFIAEAYATLTTDSNKKAWCNQVSFTSQALLPRLAAFTRDRLIPLAKAQALKRDKSTSQITGVKGTNNQENLVVHHLYNAKDYPTLADSLDNLITLTKDIHDEFHQWMGGTSVACTVDDLIKFVVQLYPEQIHALIKLNRFRTRLYAPYPPTPIK